MDKLTSAHIRIAVLETELKHAQDLREKERLAHQVATATAQDIIKALVSRLSADSGPTRIEEEIGLNVAEKESSCLRNHVTVANCHGNGDTEYKPTADMEHARTAAEIKTLHQKLGEANNLIETLQGEMAIMKKRVRMAVFAKADRVARGLRKVMDVDGDEDDVQVACGMGKSCDSAFQNEDTTKGCSQSETLIGEEFDLQPLHIMTGVASKTATATTPEVEWDQNPIDFANKVEPADEADIDDDSRSITELELEIETPIWEPEIVSKEVKELDNWTLEDTFAMEGNFDIGKERGTVGVASRLAYDTTLTSTATSPLRKMNLESLPKSESVPKPILEFGCTGAAETTLGKQNFEYDDECSRSKLMSTDSIAAYSPFSPFKSTSAISCSPAVLKTGLDKNRSAHGGDYTLSPSRTRGTDHRAYGGDNHDPYQYQQQHQASLPPRGPRFDFRRDRDRLTRCRDSDRRYFEDTRSSQFYSNTPNHLPDFFVHGISYTPPITATDTYLTIHIGSIPPTTTLSQLLPHVRGGALLSIILTDTLKLTGALSALVVFKEQKSARGFVKYVKKFPVVLGEGENSQELVVTHLQTPTYPLHLQSIPHLPTSSQPGYIQANSTVPTRCLRVLNFPLQIPIESVRHDLAPIHSTGHNAASVVAIWRAESNQGENSEKVDIISGGERHDKALLDKYEPGGTGVLNIEFASVSAAIVAYGVLKGGGVGYHFRASGLQVEWVEDPCARPLGDSEIKSPEDAKAVQSHRAGGNIVLNADEILLESECEGEDVLEDINGIVLHHTSGKGDRNGNDEKNLDGPQKKEKIREKLSWADEVIEAADASGPPSRSTSTLLLTSHDTASTIRNNSNTPAEQTSIFKPNLQFSSAAGSLIDMNRTTQNRVIKKSLSANGDSHEGREKSVGIPRKGCGSGILKGLEMAGLIDSKYAI